MESSTLQLQPGQSLVGQHLKERYAGFNVKKESNNAVASKEYNLHKRQVFIITEAGRPVYVRFGDEMESSSFIATMGAILEKFRIFFSADGRDTSKWQRLVIKHKTITFLYRKRLVYICVNDNRTSTNSRILPSSRNAFQDSEPFPSYSAAAAKTARNLGEESHEFIINNMLDFLNVQMISIMTDQVNMKLAQRPNYDPQSTLGDRNQLIGTTIKNGLHSPAILFNSFMTCPLSASHRKTMHSALSEGLKETGAIVAMLTTPNYVVDICKQKGFEFGVGDILLLQNLLQSQNSLRNSHNWIPLCLPGMSADGLIYAYITFLVEGGDLALVMISDSNDLFFKCKDSSANILTKISAGSSNSSALHALAASISGLPYSHKISSNQSSSVLKHFIILQIETKQLTFPSFVPFGKQPKVLKGWLRKYADLFVKYLTADPTVQNDFFSITRDQEEFTGVQATAEFLVFFTVDKLVQIPEINSLLTLLLKWIKVEEQTKFITKFS